MITAAYRSKVTIGSAWIAAPLCIGTALLYFVVPGASDLDAWALLAVVSSGFVGLVNGWILMKRRVPMIAVSEQTLELAPWSPFHKPSSLRVDDINSVSLKSRKIVVETRTGSEKVLWLDLDADEAKRIVAVIQRRVEEAKSAGGRT
jgi:hypothetical protein